MDTKTATKFFFAVVFVLVAGCTEPRIDTSSEDRMLQSISSVRASLPQRDRAAFDEAVQILLLGQHESLSIFEGVASSEAGNAAPAPEAYSALEGKTGLEILAEAESIRLKQETREKEQALAEIEELQMEIEELEEKSSEVEVAWRLLGKFEVVHSRYYKQEQLSGGDQPIIELTVLNGTAEPVSRAYFVGTLVSRGRYLPWLNQRFNYLIPGGLEPGEGATWSLAPDMFSDWGTVNAPDDAVFTVTVRRLDGANGESLFDTEVFSAQDRTRYGQAKQRLQMLQERFNLD